MSFGDNPLKAGPLLSQVQYPSDLRRLAPEQLFDLTQELRRYLIEYAAQYGGHFAASLGTVELTVALHYAFNTPHDLLVWDVGHQAYGHKLLTGRRDRFHTNRLYGGVSGFPKRSESEYDVLGVGHSSTSISAALGMAVAAKHKGEDRHVVAVIGDGALTGGMAFEGLNNAGWLDTDMLVILNDNCMSIDPNVGAMKEYLTDITASRTYNRLRNEIWKLLGNLGSLSPTARKLARKLEDALTVSMSKPGMLFESLGFRYFGPVDGHDVDHLVKLLDDLKSVRGPKLLHCVTVKGKGFAPAEADQTKWHAPGFKFDPDTGDKIELPKAEDIPAELLPAKPPKYQDVFGETLIELATMDSRVVGITPAMLSGSGMIKYQQTFPDRCFDVAIAEQHAATFSAGLATQGMIPFCNIYSTFMQRAFDQVVHDIAIQDLKVVLCMDRGGLVGADGGTHHGAYDIAYMRCLPNLIVSAPMNEQDLRNLMYTAWHDDQTHPFTIRYPRGEGTMPQWRTPLTQLEIGKGRVLREAEPSNPASSIAILSFGHPGNFAEEACNALALEGLAPAHYNLLFVKPLDGELLHQLFAQHRTVITVEDGCLPGGFGSAIAEWMADHGYGARIIRLGVPDRVVHHGTQAQLWAECGYDAAAIAQTVRQTVGVEAVI
jgi:1-deoxy-D-xylulose-5-phosphate synthase